MSDREPVPGGPTGGVAGPSDGENALEFRDPEKADALAERAEELVADIDADEVSVMHVCGSHEQSIAKFGLRSMLPEGLDLRMGPGCPVCVTDMPEVDEAVALANAGHTITTYGDMLHVPGTSVSLSDARAAGADVRVVYSAAEAVDIAEETDGDVVFFATGFETTAAPTAAIVRDDPPENFWVLSAHKYVPPAMEVVAAMPETDVDGFLAAGNAATITGWGLFEELVDETNTPITVGGFEPLDVLAGLVVLLRDIRDGDVTVRNAYPRCVTEQGNEPAQKQLWNVFTTESGEWRGIAHIPDANLVLRDEYAHVNARERFEIDTTSLAAGGSSLVDDCICGDIMAGRADPTDCDMFGEECTPEDPVGACMVSSEGTCKIWHEYGGRPDL
ncbi:hydrogenase formation protein HypD [Haloplanus natans]|uniref:hydrogenase formation protein HypD n=1 Tax=Haloplanus natans TaxID=376171 RepID=UPI000A02E1F5|nr:hydrogenase formation protein HypD [Haloplanus natans]